MAKKLYKVPKQGEDYTGKPIPKDLLKYTPKFEQPNNSGFNPDPRSEKIDYMMILDHSV
jgi:hypothetical protein